MEQCGKSDTASTLIDDSCWPWITGMTLTKCGPWKDSEGKIQTSPEFNIDWDTRNDVSGMIIDLGSLDFDTIEEGARRLFRQIHQKIGPMLDWKRGEVAECNECGRSVAAGSGLFVNRVPDFNDIKTRIANGKRFPEGDYLCRECDSH